MAKVTFCIRSGKATALRRKPPGLMLHLLRKRNDLAGTNPAVTCVDIARSAAQRLHHHHPERVYVIGQGAGMMTAGGDRQSGSQSQREIVLHTGQCAHGIENTGAVVSRLRFRHSIWRLFTIPLSCSCERE
jgi:mannose-6-phosphate isomerase-like protein (cupin superfamily)